ncbi:hypothetical protein Aoki45_16410 [Algoriphagus sp. oki45]|uniref:hypothetical protein n=1 Tax=Algoriphagus sp. oki45 TaxID=3067294 RepID=UPI0027EEB62C|nr:hypothetical protein Aoki45_16410 [Algoriphagus sp. oki45]
MKTIGCFLTLFLGTLAWTQAQEKIDTLSNSQKDTILYNWKFNPEFKTDSSQEGRILLDSGFTFLPKSLNPGGTIDLTPNPKFRVGIPTYQLPDPQSRMPIKTFDNSVNYTILIKEYD